jgi:hypothetical protein
MANREFGLVMELRMWYNKDFAVKSKKGSYADPETYSDLYFSASR